MIVDVHTHLWESPEQMGTDAAERIRGSLTEPWDRPEASAAMHERAMEPVQYAIIHGFVSQHIGADIPSEQIAGYVKRQPGKYLGFAGIDPLRPGIREQVHKATELGLVGVTVSPPAQNCHPTHSRAMMLYAECEKLGLPVFVHPGSQLSPRSNMMFAQPVLYDEVARSFPNLKMMFAQVGHPWVDQTMVLLSKHRHLYADVSVLVERPWELYNLLLSAHQQGVIDRLLFGSNFPFFTPEKAITAIYSVNTFAHGSHLPSVPREQLRSIVERDALRCLGLMPPVDPARTRAENTVDKVRGGIG